MKSHVRDVLLDWSLCRSLFLQMLMDQLELIDVLQLHALYVLLCRVPRGEKKRG